MPARWFRKKARKANKTGEAPPESEQDIDCQTAFAPAVDVSCWVDRPKHGVDLPPCLSDLGDASFDNVRNTALSNAGSSKRQLVVKKKLERLGTYQRDAELQNPPGVAETSLTASTSDASIKERQESIPFWSLADWTSPQTEDWTLAWALPNLAGDLSCWEDRPNWYPWIQDYEDPAQSSIQEICERSGWVEEQIQLPEAEIQLTTDGQAEFSPTTFTQMGVRPAKAYDSGPVKNSIGLSIGYEHRPDDFDFEQRLSIVSTGSERRKGTEHGLESNTSQHNTGFDQCNTEGDLNNEQRVIGIIDQDDMPPGLECSACHRKFTVRKSLLRHVRSVHRQRDFPCSHCKVRFTRKDTRDRHEIEKHSVLENHVRCLACGRYVSKRAFAEHLDSEVCRSADMLMGRSFQGLSIKFVGADDDPYLAALRMLKLFGPDTNDRTVAYIRLKLQPPNPEKTISALQYESCVARLLADQMQDPRVSPRALGLAALLLGFMAMAGQQFWGGRASMHFEGAAKIFRTHHNAVCKCSDHKVCPKWSPIAPKHSEVGLLNRLLRHVGVDHRLLEAYTPEDETALAARLSARTGRSSG